MSNKMNVEENKRMNARLDNIENQVELFKREVKSSLDEIFSKIKPRMTRAQEFGVGALLIGWLVGIMLYTTDTRSNTRNNETRIELMEGISEDISKIKEDVAYLKGQSYGKNINN